MLARTLFTLISLLFVSDVSACVVPPAHWNDSPYGMVLRTPTIVVAKAVRVDRDGVWSTAYFESVESLRGSAKASFSLRGWFESNGLNDFDGHQDPLFWMHRGASSVAPGDCSAYGVFEVGQSYLIFLDGPNYPRSFENIRSKDDLWYLTVTAALEALGQADDKL